jgi:hypothetical protein
MNREGRRFTDYFHPALIRRKLEDAMQLELVNGSIWKIEGVENMDSVIGSNPIGIVYSEFSQMKPAVRSLINPILDENGGWEIVNFTPRGKNHAYELYQMALHNPDWHCSLLTVDDTRRDAPGEDGSRLITPEQIEARRREGTNRANTSWVFIEWHEVRKSQTGRLSYIQRLTVQQLCDFDAGSGLTSCHSAHGHIW